MIVGLTTSINNGEIPNENDECWDPVIKARNQRARKLAEEFGLILDDLYSISVELGPEGKRSDGVHFNEEGNEKIGESKAFHIKKLLNY